MASAVINATIVSCVMELAIVCPRHVQTHAKNVIQIAGFVNRKNATTAIPVTPIVMNANMIAVKVKHAVTAVVVM